MKTENIPQSIRHIVVARAGDAQAQYGSLTTEGLFQVSHLKRALIKALPNTRVAVVYSAAKCSQQTAETLSGALNAQAFQSNLLKTESAGLGMLSPRVLAEEALRPIFQKVQVDGFEAVVIVCHNGMSDAVLEHLQKILGVKGQLFEGKKLTPGAIVHFDFDKNAICRSSPSM